MFLRLFFGVTFVVLTGAVVTFSVLLTAAPFLKDKQSNDRDEGDEDRCQSLTRLIVHNQEYPLPCRPQRLVTKVVVVHL